MSDKKYSLKYVRGIEGNSIYLNDNRIAGPKPWGGGKVIESFEVEEKEIEKAIHRLNKGPLSNFYVQDKDFTGCHPIVEKALRQGKNIKCHGFDDHYGWACDPVIVTRFEIINGSPTYIDQDENEWDDAIPIEKSEVEDG